MRHAPTFAGRVRTFGVERPADVRALAVRDLGIDGTAAIVRTPIGEAEIRTPLPGTANLSNVLAAAAVAIRFDVPLADIVERAAGLKPVARRGEVIRAGGVTIVDDSYNSNPKALSRALAMLAGETRYARRVAVLGEMLELGAAHQPSCTARRAKRPRGSSVERARGRRRRQRAGAGRRGAPAGMPASHVHYVENSTAAADLAATLVKPGDRRARQRIARHPYRGCGRSPQGGVRLMLYNLLYQFHTQVPVLNVIQYITFRTAAASLTALVISLLLGPWLIRKLREFQIGQIIRHEGPASHAPKAGTPTMGGLLILTASLVPTLLWADLRNVYIWIAVLATAAFGAIGFTDDYLKIVRRSHHGLLPRYKMLGQIVVALLVGVALMCMADYMQPPLYNTRLIFPFFKTLIPDLGWWYVPFAVFVLVGCVERRQSDRRSRRPGHQHVCGRRRRVHRARRTSPATAFSRTTCCSCIFRSRPS